MKMRYKSWLRNWGLNKSRPRKFLLATDLQSVADIKAIAIAMRIANSLNMRYELQNYLTQRRKGAKFKILLSVFAPLREKFLG